jgi:2-amino-4-hydroxy-6-hydroxymethyldihydropteridine diphosphokinase
VAEVFIGLGSNLGDRVGHLRRAVEALRPAVTIERISSLWRTEPVGLREQPEFLNAALRGRTELAPRALLALLTSIEAELGRTRLVPNGPRTIDLDLLAYDDVVADEPGLALPHPRMVWRRFVLAPLTEIAGELRPLRVGPMVVQLLTALPQAEAVERIEHPEWPPT